MKKTCHPAASVTGAVMLIMMMCFLASTNLSAQYPNHTLPQYPDEWNCRWITHPGIDEAAYGLIHFRNSFELKEVPEIFIIHVSGDNRYRLYVNGEEAGYGPQLSDMRHWRYETYNIAPYLKKGDNMIAAEVMNWGIDRSYGIISFKTAFLLQGNSPRETFLNTTWSSNWKVYENPAVHERPVDWIFGDEIVGGFYASNPTDSVVAEVYPWGWETADYDDSDWVAPEIIFSQPKTDAGAGHGWILQPRTTAKQVSRKERLNTIVRSTSRQAGTKEPVRKNGRSALSPFPSEYSFGDAPLTIPANMNQKILIDQGYVTLGYPKLSLSQGKDAVVKVRYSEAMYNEENHKGNRNVIEGKEIKGICDVYVMDGGRNRVFQPMWFRTFRFVQLEIETADEPLVIDDFYNIYSATDFPVKASFKTSDDSFDEVWKICWHTMEICAQDNLMSDAYYEQMQYVGDLRPHLKAWTALTGDHTYIRSALEQFNYSRLPDGNITSCYPLKATFVHPTYSLIWIDMLHDLMMLEGKKEHIEPYLSEIDEVFDYYESLINESGLVGKAKYHMFIDWYLPKGGNSPVNKDGNSAILTLNYAYTLNLAADMLEWLGYRGKAQKYRERGRMVAEITRKLCYDAERGIYADDPTHTFYDQRASILAVLCGAHNEEERAELMRTLLSDETKFDSYANLFYYFYLFEAMEKTGVGDFAKALEPWREIVAMGMSGTPEKRIEQHPRSEIHPWTAHPVHYYFSVVAGIKPASPGFSTVMIEPNPGSLEEVVASMPTVQGDISVQARFQGGSADGEVVLPAGVSGVFRYKGQEFELIPGKNTIR